MLLLTYAFVYGLRVGWHNGWYSYKVIPTPRWLGIMELDTEMNYGHHLTKFKLNMSPVQLPLSCISKILSIPMSSNPRRNVTEGKLERRKMLLKSFFFKFYKLWPCEWIGTLTGLLQRPGKYWVSPSNIFKNGKKCFRLGRGPGAWASLASQ